jgi:hypothetical protein
MIEAFCACAGVIEYAPVVVDEENTHAIGWTGEFAPRPTAITTIAEIPMTPAATTAKRRRRVLFTAAQPTVPLLHDDLAG